MRTAIHLLVALSVFAVLPAAEAQEAPDVAAPTTITGDLLRRTSPVIDPYEPLGLGAGTFSAFPALTVGVDAATNDGGGGASASVSVTPELTLRSNWSRHQATFDVRGTYRRPLTGGQSAMDAAANAALRLDLADQWTADFAAGYGYDQQSATDPDTPGGLDARPGIHAFSGSAGLAGGAGRVQTALTATVERTVYENGRSGGASVDQGYRTNTRAQVTGRLGLRTGVVTPFVEASLARRQYDRVLDNNGLRRSVTELAAVGGLSFAHGERLSGEASTGWLQAWVDDPALADVGTWTADGSLVWAASPLTTVTAGFATSLSPTTSASSSGTLRREATTGIAYAWRPNVTLTADAAAALVDYLGRGRRDTELRLGLGAAWRPNRLAEISARYEHERVASTNAGSSYGDHAVRLQMRLQR